MKSFGKIIALLLLCTLMLLTSCDLFNFFMDDTTTDDGDEGGSGGAYQILISLTGLSEKAGDTLAVALYPEGQMMGNMEDQLGACIETIDYSGSVSTQICNAYEQPLSFSAGTYTLMGIIDEDGDFQGDEGEFYLIPQTITITDQNLHVALDDTDFEPLAAYQGGGAVTVRLSGYPENYQGKEVLVELTAVGSSTVLNDVDFTIDGSGNGEGTIGDSVFTLFPAQDYDLHIFLDYDGNGSYTQNSGDSGAKKTITVLGTQENVYNYTPGDIPCLSSDSSKTGAIRITFPTASSALLPIGTSTPYTVELYSYDEADPAPTITNLIAATPTEEFDLTDTSAAYVFTLDPLTGSREYVNFCYFDADGSGTLNTGDPTETIDTMDIAAGIVLEYMYYPYTIGRANHTFPSNDRNDLLLSYNIEFTYTGTQPLVGDNPSGAYMCFILSTTDTVSIGDDFSEAAYRFYDNSEWASNGRMLLGEPDVVHYYIMLLDVDRSETVSTGDRYCVRALNAPDDLGNGIMRTFTISDGDLSEIGAPAP